MALSTLTKGPSTTNGMTIFCQNINCDNMNAGSISPASITTDNITVNETYTGSASPPIITSFSQSLLLSDGSTTQIVQSDNFLGSGIKGSGMTRASVVNPNKMSSMGVVNTIAVGGNESVANMTVRDTVIPTNLAMSVVSHDTVNFSYLAQVTQGVNTCGLSMTGGNTNLEGNQTILINNNLVNQILMAAGFMTVSSTGAIQLQSPVYQLVNFANPNPTSIVTCDNSGILNKFRYEQGTYTPVITNINRISAPAGSADSNYTVINGYCYVNALANLTVDVGVGTPNFTMSLPVAHSNFTGNVIFGSAVGTDSTLTSTIPLHIFSQAAGTSLICLMIPAVAAIYDCSFTFSYPIA